MQKKYLYALLTIVFSFLFYQNKASSSLPQIVYQLPEPTLWGRDLEAGAEIVGPEHYYFAGTTNIDLNIVPIEDDLLNSLKTRGEKQIVLDMMHGKNTINAMFAAEDSILISHNSKPIADGQLLELATTQKIGTEQFRILEKYFIFNNESVHLELRWPASADPEKVKLAQKNFASITPQSRGSGSK